MLVAFPAFRDVGHIVFEGVLVTQKPQLMLQQVVIKGVHERVAHRRDTHQTRIFAQSTRSVLRQPDDVPVAPQISNMRMPLNPGHGPHVILWEWFCGAPIR